MWKALRRVGGAAVLTGCLLPAGAAAQETVYADKVAIGTFTATTSPLTVVGLPGTGATGGILRTGTGGLIGTGPLVVGDIPGVFTASDANETITGAWTFTNGLTSGAPIVFGTGVAPPTSATRSVGTRLVLYPNVNVPPGSPNYDFAIGVDSATSWFSVPNSSGTRWAFYADDTARAAAAVPAQAPNPLVAELTGSRIFMPGAGYSGSLGLFNRKWGTVYGGELNIETLVLQDTLASTNGRQIIGVSASVLTRDFPAVDVGAPWIYVKHPAFRAGDIVLLESAGKVEWLAILSTTVDCRNVVAGTTLCGHGPGQDYGYTVTRNLDGSGQSTFYAGDTALNTGAPGDGMLDLYAQRSSTSTGYAGYVLSDRPQAYYRMNGITGATGVGGGGDLTMVDASGNGHTGTVPGGLIWARFNASVVGTTNSDPAFVPGGTPQPGGNGYFVVPRPAASPYFAGDLTVEFLAVWDGVPGGFNWLLYTGLQTGGNVAVSNGTVVLYFGDIAVPGSFQQISPAGCTLTASVTTHIALTRSQHSREVVCYKDGAEVGRTAYPATPAPIVGTGDLLVGNGFPGYLDEVAIWNRVLPPDRIAAHYGRRASNSTATDTALAAGPTIAVRIRPPGEAPTYNNIQTRAAFGNLLGDYGFTTTTYGMGIGDPLGANLIATASKLSFRHANAETLVMRNDSFAMGAPGAVPTDLYTNIGLWFAASGPYGAQPTFRVGNPNGNVMQWDGSDLFVREGGLAISEYGFSVDPQDYSGPPPTANFAPPGKSFRFAPSLEPESVYASLAYFRNTLDPTQGVLAINAAGHAVSIGFLDSALGMSVSRDDGLAPYVDNTMNLGSLNFRWSNIFVNLPPAAAAPAYVVVQGPNNQDLAYVAPVFNGSTLMWSAYGEACTMTFRAGILTATTCKP